MDITEPIRATIALCAYNQQNFIREAVQGAFSQTYSPLEIVMSDDCSNDNTFDIMKSMVQLYKGPHRIILNRNDKNLGINGNVNKTFELSSGEIWIGAAGDDVSLPERCSKTVSVFSKHKDVTSVVTYAEVFGDLNGKKTPYFIERKQGPIEVCWTFDGALGCSSAYRVNLFNLFGPLKSGGCNEDMPFLFRSMISGRHKVIPEILVRYRSHNSSTTNGTGIFQSNRSFKTQLSGWLQIKRDLPIALRGQPIRQFICDNLIKLHIQRLFEQKRLDEKMKFFSVNFFICNFLIKFGKVCRFRYPIDWGIRKLSFLVPDHHIY